MTSKKFMDTRTGEVVTQFDILDIGFMREVKEVKATDFARSMGIEVVEF